MFCLSIRQSHAWYDNTLGTIPPLVCEMMTTGKASSCKMYTPMVVLYSYSTQKGKTNIYVLSVLL